MASFNKAMKKMQRKMAGSSYVYVKIVCPACHHNKAWDVGDVVRCRKCKTEFPKGDAQPVLKAGEEITAQGTKVDPRKLVIVEEPVVEKTAWEKVLWWFGK